MKILSSLATGVFALAVASSPALATAARTFVLGTGTDTGACTLTAPCRTFAYALTQTSSNGEIIVLGSGGYGAVTIDQSVSIINTSNFAGVTVASGNGITINAGVNDSVVLRGLTVDGGGTGSNGIVFNSGGTLTINQCNLMNFVGINAGRTIGNGILVQPASGNPTIIITDTTASHNEYSGLSYTPSAGSSAAGSIIIDRVSADNNSYGITINNVHSSGNASASISNSSASGNASFAYDFSNGTFSLDASYAAANASGVSVGASATLALGRSTIMNNMNQGLVSNGVVNSYRDNRIAGNGNGQINGTAPVTATLY
jgi:hypothetical protein